MQNVKLTGYDTDAIGNFTIPKDFTSNLLCQVCFSKCYIVSKQSIRGGKRRKRVWLLQLIILQTMHWKLVDPQQELSHVP